MKMRNYINEEANSLLVPDAWGRHKYDASLMCGSASKECVNFEENALPVYLRRKTVFLFSSENYVSAGIRYLLEDYERISLLHGKIKEAGEVLKKSASPAVLIMVNDGTENPALFMSAIYQAEIYHPETHLIIISEESSRIHAMLEPVKLGFTLIGMKQPKSIIAAKISGLIDSSNHTERNQEGNKAKAECRSRIFRNLKRAKEKLVLDADKTPKSAYELKRRAFNALGIKDKFSQLVFLSVL